MAVIDVGVKETVNASGALTIVSVGNPANDTGTIDHIEVQFFGSAGTADFASFSASGNNLTTNGTALAVSVTAPGVNTLDAPGDFTAFNINTGEYIGNYGASPVVSMYASSGSVAGMWYVSGDQIPCSNVTFTLLTSYACYIYGTGATGGGAATGWMSTNTKFWG